MDTTDTVDTMVTMDTGGAVVTVDTMDTGDTMDTMDTVDTMDTHGYRDTRGPQGSHGYPAYLESRSPRYPRVGQTKLRLHPGGSRRVGTEFQVETCIRWTFVVCSGCGGETVVTRVAEPVVEVPEVALDNGSGRCYSSSGRTESGATVAGTEVAAMEERTRRENRQLPSIQIRTRGQVQQVYRYRDVLNLAYQHGLVAFEQAAPVQVVMVPSQRDPGRMIPLFISEVYAVFRNSDGSLVRFHGVGDCSYENAQPNVAAAGPRMAHTRAKARALADALNLDANLSEEFDLSEDSGSEAQAGASAGSNSRNGAQVPAEPRCSRCGGPMSQRSAEYSMRIRGELVCYRCAKGS
jgi:hypothetical protein